MSKRSVLKRIHVDLEKEIMKFQEKEQVKSFTEASGLYARARKSIYQSNVSLKEIDLLNL